MEFKAKFNPKDFLLVADFLLKNCPDDDNQHLIRTILNRSYYACYSYIEYRFRTVPNPNNLKSEHQILIKFLEVHSNPILAEISESLNDLFVSRKDADYKMDRYFKKKAAIEALDSAKEIFKLFESIEDELYINR